MVRPSVLLTRMVSAKEIYNSQGEKRASLEFARALKVLELLAAPDFGLPDQLASQQTPQASLGGFGCGSWAADAASPKGGLQVGGVYAVPDPEGPSTHYLSSLAAKTIPLMAFGARVLEYWVLGPSW